MAEPKNLRNLTVTTESGKDVRDTQMLKGESHSTKAWKETNATKQYSTGALNKGALGGKPSHE